MMASYGILQLVLRPPEDGRSNATWRAGIEHDIKLACGDKRRHDEKEDSSLFAHPPELRSIVSLS